MSPERIGVATSRLTFFQQIGGTVGLTIGGTLFADRLTAEIPTQLAAFGVPQPQIDGFVAGGVGGGQLDLTGTGDLRARIRILATVPEPFKAAVEPLPNIVDGIHQAFSIALACSFWVGIAGALVASALCLCLRDADAEDGRAC